MKCSDWPKGSGASDVLLSVTEGNQTPVVWRPHGLQPSHQVAQCAARRWFPCSFFFLLQTLLGEHYANTQVFLLPDLLCCCCCLSVSHTRLAVCLLCTGCLNPVNDANSSHETVRRPTKEFRKCHEREVVLVSHAVRQLLDSVSSLSASV